MPGPLGRRLSTYVSCLRTATIKAVLWIRFVALTLYFSTSTDDCLRGRFLGSLLRLNLLGKLHSKPVRYVLIISLTNRQLVRVLAIC